MTLIDVSGSNQQQWSPLDVTSNPSGAEIFIDGIDKNVKSPASIDVKPGLHSVQVTSPCMVKSEVRENVEVPEYYSEIWSASVNFDLPVCYNFKGFETPIVMNDFNGGTAGKAIPLKWQLSDMAGQKIDNPATFVSVNSYPVTCGVFPGTPILPIIEDYTGSSGLKNTGGGWYQFNWNTNKTYVKTCRNMYILFNNGQKSTVAAFKF
jgi:hypothetical protein